MATAKKSVSAKNDAFHSAVIEVCHEAHVGDPHLKGAINISSLVSKVEAAALAIEPGLATVLQGADVIAPAQYKPFIEAVLAAVQAGVTLIPPAPAAG